MNTSRLNTDDGNLLLRLKESKLGLKSTLSFEVNEIKCLKRDIQQSFSAKENPRAMYFFNKLDMFFDRLANDLDRYFDRVEVELLNSSDVQQTQYNGLMELKFSQENNFSLLREQINNLKLKNELLVGKLNNKFSSMSKKLRQRKHSSSSHSNSRDGEGEARMVDKACLTEELRDSIQKEERGTSMGEMAQQADDGQLREQEEKNKKKIREMKTVITKYEEVG